MHIDNILVANNQLDKFGGSETFTFAIIEELKRRNFNVEYFTFKKGKTSNYIEKLGVPFSSKKKYDLILANHNTCVQHLHKKGIIIQTCHGIYPDLEQPSIFADSYVSITEEVKKHLEKNGFKSTTILNGINFRRYNIKNPISKKIKTILSLTQSETANLKIKEVCRTLNLEYLELNKNNKSSWHVENFINKADLVFAIGRSAYEAMACGRPVIIYDERHYFEAAGDGYLTLENFDNFVLNNCSGRTLKLKFSYKDLINEIKKYKESDSILLRQKADKVLNIQNKVDDYLHIASQTAKKPKKIKLNDLYGLYKTQKTIRRQIKDYK